MSTSYIIISFWPYLCQKLSMLVEIWQSYDKNNFDCFFLRHDVLRHNDGGSDDRATFDDDSDVVRHLSDRVLEEARVDAGVSDYDALDGHLVVGWYRDASRPGQLLSVLEPRQCWCRDAGRLARQLDRGALALNHEAGRRLSQLRRSCKQHVVPVRQAELFLSWIIPLLQSHDRANIELVRPANI